MSGLMFRASPSERVIRSVGDPPHGVVGVIDFYLGAPPAGHALADGERFAIIVDPNTQPPPDTGGEQIILGDFANGHVISYEDAIRACVDVDTANMVCSMVVGSASVGFQIGAQRLDVGHVTAAAAAIEKLADTIRRSVDEGWAPAP